MNAWFLDRFEFSESRRGASGVLSVVVGLCCALLPQTAAAYRTAADQPEFAGTERVRWLSDEIPYFVHISDFPGYDYALVDNRVRAGAERWAAPLCTGHSVVPTGAQSSGDNTDGVVSVAWSSYWAELGYPADALGATDLVYEQDSSGRWHITDADILFNDVNFQWLTTGGDPGTDGRNIEAAVAHEWGHVIGLLHPCEPGGVGAPDCGLSDAYAETTMYPYYTGPGQASLSPDDEAGGCFLYPPLPCEPACMGEELCVDGTCQPSCGGTLCTFGQTCVDGICQADCGTSCGAGCSNDAECSTGYVCVAGRCAQERLALGDPCAQDADCASEACRDHVCTVSCGGGCPSRFVCEAPDDPNALCLPAGGVYGDECLQGEDCVSNLCVVGVSSVPLCSRYCDLYPSCPRGDHCETVDGRPVCLPGTAPGGCSVLGPRSTGATPTPMLASLLLILLFRLFRTREKP